jgi:hypothetical protein
MGAQPAEETEEMDEAREERELSEIIDSGEDDRDEFEAAREGRRLGKWYASKPFLMLGLNWSTQVRAMKSIELVAWPSTSMGGAMHKP